MTIREKPVRAEGKIAKTIGEKVAAKRKALGMTQKELAKKAGYESWGAISKIETGRLDFSVLESLTRVAETLGLTLIDLLSDKPVEHQDRKQIDREMIVDLIQELRDCRNLAVYSEYWWNITMRAADALDKILEESVWDGGPPCKKGDKLWSFCTYPCRRVFDTEVLSVSFFDGKGSIFTYAFGAIPWEEVGRSVFKTKEEAEAALAARK